MIPDGWKETTLGEAVEIYKSPWKPGNRTTKYIGLEHINQNDLSINGYGSSAKLESNKFIFNKGDILFGKLRPYFRKVWKAKFDGICSTDIWVLRAKEKYDQQYLFYFIANPAFIEKTTGASTGTRMPRADWSFLKNTLWHFPPLPEQKAIADVLSSFDNKIELLREQNKTLEAIAQTIFDEWFVRFNFPDENGKPYQASGGKMIDSELGPIPEGWRVGKLGEEFKVVMGQSPEGESYNEAKDGIIFFQGRTDFKDRFPEVRLYTTNPKRFAEKFDVLVSVRAPVGDINVASEKCCIGRGLCAVRSNFKSYSLYKIKTLQDIFNNFETEGTIFGSINKDSMLDIKVVVPSSDAVMNFEEKVNSIDRKIYNNYLQIQALSTLRDELLPKLMKGELWENMINRLKITNYGRLK